MDDARTTTVVDEPEIMLEGFGPEEAKALKELLVRFLREYGKKPPELNDENWLCQRFQAELPDMAEDEARRISCETFAAIKEYDQNLASLKSARAQGSTVEEWFADKSREAAAGIAAIEFGRRMEELGDILSTANRQLYITATTQNGAIKQQLNLDGFLAEQQAVNSFNVAAKLNNSPFYAEVCAPEAGQPYGKNSFDVVIRGERDQIVHQYQFKFGKDPNATIQMLKRGNYNNQTIVVPKEQVEAVQAAFPGKTVVSHIGGTEEVPVASTPMSKSDVKTMQEEIQSTGTVPELDWNSFDNRMLGKFVGSQAMQAGIRGAMLGAGFSLAAKLVSDEPIEAEDVVVDALRTGADTGVKAATAGAIMVAAERGTLGVLTPLTKAIPTTHPIANLACVAVENAKTLGHMASGELTAGEALDQMGCNTTAMCFGFIGIEAVGMTVLGGLSVVNPFVGGLVSGVIGYTAGSKVGESIYKAAKTVAKTAVKTVKKVAEGAKKVGGAIKRGIGRIFGRA